MNKKNITILALFVAVAVLLVIFFLPQNDLMKEDDNSSLPNLGVAPSFKFEDYRGSMVSLDNFKGKPVVINSWASWCPFCINELPDFVSTQEFFGDQIKIIAINRAESKEIAKKFSDQVEATDKLIFLLDPKDSFYQSIGGFSMPETIFVDKEGNIRIHKRGPMNKMEIKDKINALLEKN